LLEKKSFESWGNIFVSQPLLLSLSFFGLLIDTFFLSAPTLLPLSSITFHLFNTKDDTGYFSYLFSVLVVFVDYFEWRDLSVLFSAFLMYRNFCLDNVFFI